MKKKLVLCLFFALNMAKAQMPNYNVTLKSTMTFPGQTLANICGYVDSLGNEYALLGGSQGMIIVDVTNPANPINKKQIPGPNNLWKEIKVYKKHAYVTSEGGQGLQIVDLSKLPDFTNVQSKYWKPTIGTKVLNTIHSLHIDTTKGNVYLFGSNISNGGAVIASLSDPWNPNYIGSFAQNYVHDGYVDNDTLFSCNIYAGNFHIIDCTNKNNMQVLATTSTPTTFTHNAWITKDRKHVLTTDENDGSFLTAYDYSDLNNIVEVDRFQTHPGSTSVVHNVQIRGEYAITSWYTEGFDIVDVTRPNNLIEVGHYDTYTNPNPPSTEEGDWGVFPFFPSGTIVVSNIDEGLFVFSPTYKKACYLEGNVKDSITLANLSGVSIKITALNLTDNSKFDGKYATGTVTAGTYSVTYSKNGYVSQTKNNVVLTNGILKIVNVKLLPITAGLADIKDPEQLGKVVVTENEIKLLLSEAEDATKVKNVELLNVNGQKVSDLKLNNDRFTTNNQLSTGIYFVRYTNQDNAVLTIKFSVN